ncbi:MAG TPA: AAA family ATPase [Edaphobacter sp.]|uniref:AAA family ATPase n=1 Tax=Edaphobacter sp. TaxID=1934404 RepID=UPI002CC9F6C5|nr:AAA family ATPase [Edaphobacter sp.]HUZ97456.1 AAA family ATPase [Edaphobacter sp.]
MTDIRNLVRPLQNLSIPAEKAAPVTAPIPSTLSSLQLQSLQTLATQLGESPQTGTITIFTGPDTAAKAAAAQTLANNLHRELRTIDLGSVVNQDGGDPGSALTQILSSNTRGVLLLLDEADALFGKRTDVQDSHDKYASIEISFLLQAVRQYSGIIILAVTSTDGWDHDLLARAHTTLKFPPNS